MLSNRESTTYLRRYILLVTACLLLVGLFSAQTGASMLPIPKRPYTKKVVLVVVPAISLKDISRTDLPNLRKLTEIGGVGVMNARTAGLLDSDPGSFDDSMYTPESGYLTLGAGARALVGFDARKAYDYGEKVDGTEANQVFERLTLVHAHPADIVHTGIVSLIRDVSGLNYKLVPGYLGEALHAAGLKTAAVGNSDDQTVHREIATISMDQNGLVDYGDVNTATPDPTSPLGMRTNTQRLIGQVERCIDQSDFIAVDLGDTARIDRARLDMLDRVYHKQRDRILKDTDKTLGELLTLVNLKDTYFVVLTPYPESYTLEKTEDSLCPVIIAGPGYTQGMLTSGSTRVPGALVSIDIAPSVLEWLGVHPSTELVGRTIDEKPGTLADLQETDRRIALQNRSQSVLQQSAVVTIILVSIITILWFLLPAAGFWRKKVLPIAILFPTAFAAAMLAMGSIPTGSLFTAWVCMLAISTVILGIALAIGRTPIRALMVICLAVSAGLVIDMGLGGALSRYSVMSYSVIEGARYYGMGNEFMGTLIGASLVGLGLLLSSLNTSVRAIRVALGCALVIETAAIGSPQLGANVGGAIAVLTGFAFALMITSKKPLNFRKVASIVFGVAAVIAIFSVLDSLRGSQHETHLGRAVSQIRAGGLDQAAMIIKRKMGMNIMLVMYSSWSKLCLAFLASCAVALKVGDVYRRLRPVSLYTRVILAGTISGTLAALIFNDSGVVAAGTSFIYTWALVLLSAMEQNDA